ncbi:hypothetical protein BKI52_08300 [marine bacterium AO1-C]|nr:hypothetical protein BKI52_08300 [marine bacterium AO1-C]
MGRGSKSQIDLTNMKSQVVIRFLGLLCFFMSYLYTLQAQEVIPFQNKKGKWGYKNAKKRVKVKPQYDHIQEIVLEAKDQLFKRFIVKQHNKYALFDNNGEQLSKFSYDAIYPPTCDKPVKLILVKRKEKYGYLDHRGIERLALIYADAEPFCKGITRVRQGEKWTTIGKVVKKKAAVKKETFTIVEDRPVPKGGMRRYYKYINDNLRYPPDARRLKAEGKVFVMLTIEGGGNLKNIEVLRGIGNGCELEAVRLITNGPKWQPFMARGSRKRSQKIVIPITFKLE